MDGEAKQEGGGAKAAPEQDFSQIKQGIAENNAKAASLSQNGPGEDHDKQFADLAEATDRVAGRVGGNAGHFRPRVGAGALYRLSADDAESVNRRRDQSNAHRALHVATANGTMIHVGNKVAEGDIFPMLIVRTWENLPNVNGKVFLDGNDELWVQSVREGDGAGQFSGG